MQNIAIIGREKSLAYAEMESVFGDINKVGRDTVIFTGGGPESIKNLGSVIKIGQIFHCPGVASSPDTISELQIFL